MAAQVRSCLQDRLWFTYFLLLHLCLIVGVIANSDTTTAPGSVPTSSNAQRPIITTKRHIVQTEEPDGLSAFTRNLLLVIALFLALALGTLAIYYFFSKSWHHKRRHHHKDHAYTDKESSLSNENETRPTESQVESTLITSAHYSSAPVSAATQKESVFETVVTEDTTEDTEKSHHRH